MHPFSPTKNATHFCHWSEYSILWKFLETHWKILILCDQFFWTPNWPFFSVYLVFLLVAYSATEFSNALTVIQHRVFILIIMFKTWLYQKLQYFTLYYTELLSSQLFVNFLYGWIFWVMRVLWYFLQL